MCVAVLLWQDFFLPFIYPFASLDVVEHRNTKMACHF
jgi:hypothetical protein